MILLIPHPREGRSGWAQVRVKAPPEGLVAGLGRLLRWVSQTGLAEALICKAGQKGRFSPEPGSGFSWAPDPELRPWISDSDWRREQLQLRKSSKKTTLSSPRRPAPELCWLWSPSLSRWETPLFLMQRREKSKGSALELSFQAAASLLFLWDAEALRLTDEWGRELEATDLIEFAQTMSAQGMRLYGRECFGAQGPDFEAPDLARWNALMEAKELELFIHEARSQDDSGKKRL